MPVRYPRALLLSALLFFALASLGGFAVTAFSVYREALERELDADGTAVARAIARQVNAALGYGMNLHEMRGLMKPFLADMLEDNPIVDAIAIAGPDGRTLASAGLDLPGDEQNRRALRDLDSAVRAGAAADAVTVAPINGGVGRRMIAVSLLQNGDLAGTLVIGTSFTALGPVVGNSLGMIILVLLGVAVLLYELLRHVLLRQIDEPLTRLNGAVAAIAAGDFAEPHASAAENELGRAGRSLGELARTISQKRTRLVAQIEAMLRSEFDQDISGRLRQIQADIDGRYRFGRDQAKNVAQAPPTQRFRLIAIAALAVGTVLLLIHSAANSFAPWALLLAAGAGLGLAASRSGAAQGVWVWRAGLAMLAVGALTVALAEPGRFRSAGVLAGVGGLGLILPVWFRATEATLRHFASGAWIAGPALAVPALILWPNLAIAVGGALLLLLLGRVPRLTTPPPAPAPNRRAQIGLGALTLGLSGTLPSSAVLSGPDAVLHAGLIVACGIAFRLGFISAEGARIGWLLALAGGLLAWPGLLPMAGLSLPLTAFGVGLALARCCPGAVPVQTAALALLSAGAGIAAAALLPADLATGAAMATAAAGGGVALLTGRMMPARAED